MLLSLVQQYAIDFLVLLLPLMLFPLIGLLLCLWVYRDAQRRGMDAVLWLIVVLVGNIIGLIVYLIVRNPETVRGAAAPYSTAQYCRYCGNPLPSDARFCPKCGREQT